MTSLHTPRYKRLLAELSAERKKAGITQADLAKQLGKPQSYVSKYEKGERRLDVIEFLEIAESLDIDYRKIITRLNK